LFEKVLRGKLTEQDPNVGISRYI